MALQNIRLPRLDTYTQLVDNNGVATVTFSQWWDSVATQLENGVNGINEALNAADLAQAAADTAQAAADTAQAAAATAQASAGDAQGTADANAAAASLTNSFIVDGSFTPPLISADSSGNVTIATHDRQYGDTMLNPTVTVNGATIGTGYAASTVARIYYDDASRAGGSVSYQATTDPSVSAQLGDRHSVGAVTIPAAGSQSGKFVRAPGFVEP